VADPRSDIPDVDTVVALRLRQAGQRLTPRRRSLLRILRSAVRPLTIHEILDRGSELAMSSAYRNLTVLERAGVVNRVITKEDFARYELAEELTEHHHHLVCSSCGLVRDLHPDVDAERLMNKAMHRATEQGFTPATHRLDIVGLCADCAARERASPPAGASV
jgi:Fur family transcriptional regulator, ferric uptake regulator